MTATLLFDLDGTITETDHVHFDAFKTAFTPHGVSLDWDAYTSRIMGRNNREIAAEFLPHVPVERHPAIMDEKEATYRARITSLEAAVGLTALLDWADAASIPCAVVTNAPRPNADLVLDTLAIRDRFRLLVIGPELREAKPHPLPYLTALEALGGDPDRSVAFEDSLSGVRSAAAAGLAVVGLTVSLGGNDLRGAGATITARDFHDDGLVQFVEKRTRG